MKKIFVILFFVILGVLFCNVEVPKVKADTSEVRAIYISYIELNKYVKNEDISISKNNINKMIANVKNMKFNTIILQVTADSQWRLSRLERRRGNRR